MLEGCLHFRGATREPPRNEADTRVRTLYSQ